MKITAKSSFTELWHTFKKNKLAVFGLVIFILFFLIAIFGLYATSTTHPIFDPAKVRLEAKLLPPLTRADPSFLSKDEIPPLGIFIFGTDHLGRDVFSRMLQGAWVSLTVGFVAVSISVFIGIIIGGIAGYYGNKRISLDYLFLLILFFVGIVVKNYHTIVGFLLIALCCILIWLKLIFKIFFTKLTILIDSIIMGIIDIMLCFPSFFLILTVVALLPPSIYNIMIVIGLTSWMGTARFIRAEFLSLREREFVLAAKALNISDFKIIFKHMLPNGITPVLVSATIGIASAILTEAGLSFLGFGVPPPHATWGNILSEGKYYLFDAPWLTIIPGIAILIVVLAFNLFGEGLRDALNPKARD
ncbi:ABC transporter permease [Desulfothermus naphthae]